MAIRVIGFGELSIQLIFPFLVSVSRNLRLVVFNVLDISKKLKQYPFLISIFMSLSQVLGGLLEFVVCLNETHKEKELNVHTIQQFQKVEIENESPNQLTLKSFSILLLITILSIIENDVPVLIGQYIADDITNLRYQLKIVNIFFIAVISIRILNYPLYKHQYVSISVIVIGLFFLLFQSLKMNKVKWYITVSLTLCYSLVSVQKVCEKYLMHYKYFSPYRILLYEGTLGVILSIIIEIILSFIPCPKGWFCKDNPSLENPLLLFQNIDWEVVLYIFFYVLFVGNIFIWSILTNKYFTPTHIVISDIFSAFLYWAMNFYYEKDPFTVGFIVMSLFGFIITMFGAFIYTEIVIVHMCSLSYYTKVEIRKRCTKNYEETLEFTVLDSQDFALVERVVI